MTHLPFALDLVLKLPPEWSKSISQAVEASYWVGFQHGVFWAALALIVIYLLRSK